MIKLFKFIFIITVFNMILYANKINNIGVYDSRAVAVAFVGTKAFKKWLKKTDEELKFQQEILHKQVFGTMAIDNILEYLDLNILAKQMNINIFLSKWDSRLQEKYLNVNQIDVTIDIIKLIKPNKKQFNYAIKIMKTKPKY